MSAFPYVIEIYFYIVYVLFFFSHLLHKNAPCFFRFVLSPNMAVAQCTILQKLRNRNKEERFFVYAIGQIVT